MMQKESNTDRWLRTGFVLFIIVLLMLIIFNGTAKTSDVSNWIIAFANIVMAAAAVVAWRGARRFLSEFFAQEGYRLAIAFVNENVIQLGIDNEFTLRTQKALAVCSELNGDRHSELGNKRFADAVSQLEALLINHKDWLSNMRSLSFRMETYGIYAAENKKKAMTEMVIALDRMILLGEKALDKLKTDSDFYNWYASNDALRFHPFQSKHVSETRELLKEINKEWNLMVLARDRFLSGGKHAKELFSVRED
jgi:hypothetical protein